MDGMVEKSVSTNSMAPTSTPTSKHHEPKPTPKQKHPPQHNNTNQNPPQNKPNPGRRPRHSLRAGRRRRRPPPGDHDERGGGPGAAVPPDVPTVSRGEGAKRRKKIRARTRMDAWMDGRMDTEAEWGVRCRFIHASHTQTPQHPSNPPPRNPVSIFFYSYLFL